MRFGHEFIDMTLAGFLFAGLAAGLRAFIYPTVRFDPPATMILASGLLLGAMLWWVIVLRPGRFTAARGLIAGAVVGVLTPLVAALASSAMMAVSDPSTSVTAGWNVGYAITVVTAVGSISALAGGILGMFLARLG